MGSGRTLRRAALRRCVQSKAVAGCLHLFLRLATAIVEDGKCAFSAYARHCWRQSQSTCLGSKDLFPLPLVSQAELVFPLGLSDGDRHALTYLTSLSVAGLNYLYYGMRSGPVRAKAAHIHTAVFTRQLHGWWRMARAVAQEGADLSHCWTLNSLKTASLGGKAQPLVAKQVDMVTRCAGVASTVTLPDELKFLEHEVGLLFPHARRILFFK